LVWGYRTIFVGMALTLDLFKVKKCGRAALDPAGSRVRVSSPAPHLLDQIDNLHPKGCFLLSSDYDKTSYFNRRYAYRR